MDAQAQIQLQMLQKSCKVTNTPPPDAPVISGPRSTKHTHSHVCPHCQASFRRDEHLQRHIRTHTGEKKYRCPCKMTFARNDVFVRHMRICRSGLSDEFRSFENKSRCRTKTKRACDECAKAKTKCNYQMPCDRCHRKSIKCEKTRKGYQDPYAIYSTVTSSATTPVTTETGPDQMNESSFVGCEHPVKHLIHHTVELGPGVIAPSLGPAPQIADNMCFSETEPSLFQDLSDNEQNTMVLMQPPSPQITQVPDSAAVFIEHYDVFTEYELVGNHASFALGLDPVSLHLTARG